MNNTVIAIVVGFAAAVGAVFIMDSLRADQGGSSANPSDLSGIEARLEAIEARLPAAGSGPMMGATGIPTALLDRLEAIERALKSGGGGAALAEGADAPAGSLARIDERLASIEEKLEGGEESLLAEPKRKTKKRVSLADAAKELELSGQQEDELLQIYERFHGKMYKIAAGPNGDPEKVKEDVLAARGDPTKAMGLMGKYMGNIVGGFAGLMEAQTERDDAINKLLGPEKAESLRSDYDVKEDNILGIGGGARTEFRMGGR